ncbi:MAG: mannose-1-phosphate guanylyltransferase [Marinilabiliaceae bacterium]|nr:mannose-1-phosphate guanylyltransferase [Marinilabiliaceae bacterium]
MSKKNIEKHKEMNENNHLVIMAGGVGSRFWPMSRPDNPKQFIDVLGVGQTLLQLTVSRFGAAFSPDHIWVVTSEQYKNKVHEQLPEIPEDNILLEPCMRNTAPCIAYVAWKICNRYPDATIVVSPSDHFVVDGEMFRATIEQGLNFVRGTSRVLTLGMKPTRPDTGYGYIQQGENVDGSFSKVNAFKEKPVLEVAKQYLADGGYYWNAGIFMWDAAVAKESIRTFEPEIAAVMDKMEPSFYTENEQSVVGECFPQCKNISIDYAVMERLGGKEATILGRPSSVYVLPADFGWSDLGTWGSLYTQIEKDDASNAIIGRGKVKMIESNGCMVCASGNVRMVLQGLENYIVAEDNGTLLICKKDQEQRIKEFSSDK